MTNQTNAAAVTVAPVVAKVPLVLAAVSIETVAQVGKGFASAVAKDEAAKRTFLLECVATAKLIGVPLTAAQYDKQVAPAIVAAFKAKRGLTDAHLASNKSRLKTITLAVLCGDVSLQPVAGESQKAYLERAAGALEKVTLANGSPIYAVDKPKTGRPTKTNAKGSSAPLVPKGTDTADTETGFDVRPMLAAALMLTGQNASMAQRLVIACETYKPELAKWLETILSDKDKAEAETLVGQPKDQDAPSTVPATIMGVKLAEARAKKLAKANA